MERSFGSKIVVRVEYRHILHYFLHLRIASDVGKDGIKVLPIIVEAQPLFDRKRSLFRKLLIEAFGKHLHGIPVFIEALIVFFPSGLPFLDLDIENGYRVVFQLLVTVLELLHEIALANDVVCDIPRARFCRCRNGIGKGHRKEYR